MWIHPPILKNLRSSTPKRSPFASVAKPNTPPFATDIMDKKKVKHLPLNIILVGMPGSGKTTVGVHLSRLVHKRFIDTDRLLVKQFKMPIVAAFERFGETQFRDAESALCETLLTYRHSVISTGGGIVGRPINRTLLRASGRVVYLKLSIETLWKRLKNDRSRPLLKTESPYTTLCNLYDVRDPLYQDCAHHVVEVYNQSPSEVATLIWQVLQQSSQQSVKS